jgi:hypothetical protein
MQVSQDIHAPVHGIKNVQRKIQNRESEMKVYISGLISGRRDHNKEAFDQMEEFLISQGHVPINPHKLPHDHDKSWESYMREDIKALCECDGIVMIRGSKRSPGAQLELLIARSLGMTVHKPKGEE